MAGINLSQSIVEKQVQDPKKKSGGMVAMTSLFLLTLLAWGGVEGANFIYDGKIKQANDLIEAKKADLMSPAVSEIADVEARLSLAENGIDTRIHPQAILIALENTLLPSVRLTAFDYDDTTGKVKLEGVAPGYKEVAQQVMALKTSARFSDTEITLLSRDKESSGIQFSFESKWAEKK